jgi:N6-adenosine-specific RNA methylase IME4
VTRYRTIVADPPWPIGDFPEWADGEGMIACPYPTMTIGEIQELPVRSLSNNVDADAHLYLWAVDQYLDEAFDVARSWGFHHAATIVWCKNTMGTGLGGIWPSSVEFVLFCRRPKVTTRPDVLRLTSHLAAAAERAGLTRADVDRAMGTSDMAGWWLSRLEHRCACPTDEQWPHLKRLLHLGEEMDSLVAEINTRKGSAPPAKITRAPGRWFQWKRGAHSAKPEAFLDLVEQVSPGPYLEMFARRNRLGWDTWGNEALEHVELPS